MTAAAFSTGIGLLAPFLWALPAVILTEIEGVPSFELLAVFLFCSFATTVSLALTRGERSLLSLTPYEWAAGTVGIGSNQIFYVLGVKLAPAEHAVLIYYSWPILFVLFSIGFSVRGFSIKTLLAALLAFSGVVLIVCGGSELHEEALHIFWGYLFSFLAALGWSLYTLYSEMRSASSPYILGLCCGAASLLCLFIHFLFEQTVPLDRRELFLLLLLGSAVISLSLIFWEVGIKKGNAQFLGVFSFITPLFTVALLMWQEKCAWHPSMALAGLLIVAGSVFSREKEREEVKGKTLHL